MKIFIRKLTTFILGLIILIILILVMPYSPKTNKQMFIEQKKDSLFNNVKSPRIIFIGGSNLTFGLNSQIIKDSLKLNPINTGIHAEIGLKYMLRSSIQSIKEGDTIILIPEYHQFYDNLAEGGIVLLPLLFEVSHKFDIIDIKQGAKLIQYIPKYISSKLKFWNDLKSDEQVQNSIDGLNSYNKYGDVYMHWNLPKPDTFVKYDIGNQLNMEAIEILKVYSDVVKNKKAFLFVSFPCFSESSFNEYTNQIELVESMYKDLQLNILGSPDRYKFKDSLIFNTAYHLTYEGVKLRTEFLVDDFKNARTHNTQ